MALFLHKEAPFNGDLFLGRSLNPPFRGDGQKHPISEMLAVPRLEKYFSFYFLISNNAPQIRYFMTIQEVTAL